MRILGALLVVACLGCGAEQSSAEPNGAAPAPTPIPRSAILIVVDGLRPDAIGHVSTPAIARLAADGASFEAHTADASCKASAATLLTSLPLDRHRVWSDASMVPEIVWTLPEVLRCNGFATAAFSAHGLVSARFRFGQGFDRFDGDPGRPASEVLASAAAWIAEHQRDRFFAYLHLADPLSYEPPPPFAPPDDRLGHVPSWIDEVNSRRHTPTEPEVQAVRARYAGTLRAVDAALATFFAELERLGLAGSTIVVLTGDHATALGERGWFGHPDEPELRRVPLVVRGAPPLPQLASVDHVDVAPTLLELLAIPLPDRFEGRSIGPRALAPPPGPHIEYPDTRHVFTREQCEHVVCAYGLDCRALPSEAELTQSPPDVTVAPCPDAPASPR